MPVDSNVFHTHIFLCVNKYLLMNGDFVVFEVVSLALVPILGTRGHYYNWLPMWPPDQMALLAFVLDLANSWRLLN